MESWLNAQLEDVPAPALAETIRNLLGGAPVESEDDLVSAAVELLDRVAEGSRGRTSALELLAADAILTYAFAAAADPRLGGSAGRALRLVDRAGPSGWLGELPGVAAGREEAG